MTKPIKHNTAHKKKRRLKKPVRRGCAVFFWIVALGIGSLLWDNFAPSFDTPEPRDEYAEEPPYIAPEDTAILDSTLIERLDRYVRTAPRIERSRLGVYVYDITARTPIFGHRDTVPMIPASCTKLLTAAVALHQLGPYHAYDSRLMMYGSVSRGTLYGSLIVSMDDDPLFSSFGEFAAALRRAGVNHVEGSIVFDLARTDTLRAHHTASPWDIRYHRLPLLMKGERFVRREFMTALAAHEVTYRPNVLMAHPWLQGLNPADHPAEYRVALSFARSQSETIARESRPFSHVLAPMMLYSDNILAEAVYHHSAHALDRWTGRKHTAEQVTARFIREELRPDSADLFSLRVHDGSGLSPANRFTSRFLVHLLTYAYDHPFMRPLLTEEYLPCPRTDHSGTLHGRMKPEKCTGRVFAKTGTLATKGVSSLSGYCLGSNGHWYAFAILHDDQAIYEARIFQDNLCGILVE